MAKGYSTFDEYDYTFKLLLTGDRVGKTSIINSFSCGRYDEPECLSNIGIDFETKFIEVDGKKVKIHLWEAPCSRWHTITSAYYRGAHGVMMVYDVTDEETFDSVTNTWLNSADNYAKPDVVKMVVGNKIDLEVSRVVSKERGQLVADDNGALFSEVSAKSGANIDQSFIDIVRAIYKETI